MFLSFLYLNNCRKIAQLKAGIAQLVEYKLPKLGVAGSNPVARSRVTLFKGPIPFLRLLTMLKDVVNLLQIVGEVLVFNIAYVSIQQ